MNFHFIFNKINKYKLKYKNKNFNSTNIQIKGKLYWIPLANNFTLYFSKTFLIHHLKGTISVEEFMVLFYSYYLNILASILTYQISLLYHINKIMTINSFDRSLRFKLFSNAVGNNFVPINFCSSHWQLATKGLERSFWHSLIIFCNG